ncbi:hypothetical protein ACFPRL_17840 [Pseudoclavibacter helvolus]
MRKPRAQWSTGIVDNVGSTLRAGHPVSATSRRCSAHRSNREHPPPQTTRPLGSPCFRTTGLSFSGFTSSAVALNFEPQFGPI